MKKKLFLLFFLITGGLFGQQTPEFEFELYFEDAAGNKDTITLGYDENATDSVDIAFGEANLAGQLWGEDLDVRIGDIAYSYDSWFSSNGVPFVTIDSNSFL